MVAIVAHGQTPYWMAGLCKPMNVRQIALPVFASPAIIKLWEKPKRQDYPVDDLLKAGLATFRQLVNQGFTTQRTDYKAPER